MDVVDFKANIMCLSASKIILKPHWILSLLIITAFIVPSISPNPLQSPLSTTTPSISTTLPQTNRKWILTLNTLVISAVSDKYLDVEKSNMEKDLGFPLHNVQLSGQRIILGAGFHQVTRLRNRICKLIQTRKVRNFTISPNIFFYFFDKSLKARGVYEVVAQTIYSLGFPAFTWFPDFIGHLKLNDELPMIAHLEPSNRHVAEAVVDFLHTYNWTMAVLLVSNKIPGHENFVQEVKKVQLARLEPDHPKHFKLEITLILYFEGIENIAKCFKSPEKEKCQKRFHDQLQNILNNDDRVIVFHGAQFDLSFFHHIAVDVFKDKFSHMFGDEFIWITTPNCIPRSHVSKFTMEDEEYTKEMQFISSKSDSSGLFALDYFGTQTRLQEQFDLLIQIWSTALLKLYNIIKADLPNASHSAIMDELTPDVSCDSDNSSHHWKWGKELIDLIKTTTVEVKKEYIGFFDDGHTNKTLFTVLNSRFVGSMKKALWCKVGTWTMSSDHGTRLRIDGVTWPGGANKPPIGRPSKFKLRVATVGEPPFVIYGKVQDSGVCDSSSIPCRVRLAKNQSMDDPGDLNIPDPNVPFEGNFTENTTMACCAGMTMDILRELMKDLDFDVDLYEVHDKQMGESTSKGWTGLVREIMNGQADLVMTSFKITPNRSRVVDFSVPFQETGISVVVALREGAISPTAFLQPYDFLSWLVILLFSVHSCGTAIFIYEWLSPQGLDRGNVPPREHKFSLFRSLWLIWAMLFGAAVNTDNPRGVASRFLASIWALFALVFLASYTANLAAFMIAKEEIFKINGLDDDKLKHPWNQKPAFRFATVANSATERILANTFPDMVAYMQRYNKSSVEEGVKALKAGEVDAFIYDGNILEYKAANDESCRLRIINNWFGMSGYGVGFPKNSKWVKLFNERILYYQKHGQLQRWKKFWLSGACKKSQELGNTNKTLGVKNFISAFILLLTGMILCVILLILEHFFFWYMRPKLGQCDKYGCCGLISLSVGQLLSFEQSVNQTVDMIKHFKCRNPICQTQMWKVRHELDMANRKIGRLEMILDRLSSDNSSPIKQGMKELPNSTRNKRSPLALLPPPLYTDINAQNINVPLSNHTQSPLPTTSSHLSHSSLANQRHLSQPSKPELCDSLTNWKRPRSRSVSPNNNNPDSSSVVPLIHNYQGNNSIQQPPSELLNQRYSIHSRPFDEHPPYTASPPITSSRPLSAYAVGSPKRPANIQIPTPLTQHRAPSQNPKGSTTMSRSRSSYVLVEKESVV